jgi:hypothetical protein
MAGFVGCVPPACGSFHALITGCEFSGMQKLLAVAMAYCKRGRRKWCGEKNTWHAVAAWRMEGA